MRAQLQILALLISCILPPNAISASHNTRWYHNRALQIEFRIPVGWQVRGCSSGDKAVECIALRPSKESKAPEPAIQIEIRKTSLDEAIGSHVLFEKRDGVWIKQGRFNESQAKPISGENWKGIEASASCGISDQETGFHAAAGVCYTAFISNGGRSVMIETDGFESTIDTAILIKRSFRFTGQ